MLTLLDIETTTDILIELPDGFGQEEQSAIQKYLYNLLQEAKSIDHLNLDSLRLISIAHPFTDAVYRWQRQLDLQERVTLTPYGIAMGKELTWKGKDGQLRSMVIFSAELFLAMVQGDTFAKSTFFHELAHVHDESKKQEQTGEPKKAYANDLPQILYYLSDALWAEYYAERMVHRHLSDRDFELIRGHTSIIAEAFGELETKRREYRIHANLDQFWQESIERVSLCSTTIGRLLGAFHEKEKELHDHSFIDDFHFSDEWKGIARDLRQQLAAIHIQGWSQQSVKNLEPAILRMWLANSVIPSVRSEGLYIDVPFTNRDADLLENAAK